jgi:uroporphyrinogen-III synthase
MQLLNRKIVVTRPKQSSEKLIRQLQAEGFSTVNFPLIDLRIAKNAQQLLEQVKSANELYDWVVFTSPASAEFFFSLKYSADIFNKIAVVGDKTAQIINNKGYNVSFIPSKSDFDTLLNEFPAKEQDKVLFPHSKKTDISQIERLKQKVQLTEFVLYENFQVQYSKEECMEVFENAAAITFFSPSAVQSFCKQINQFLLTLPSQITFYSIGNKTTKALISCGFQSNVKTVSSGKTDEMVQLIKSTK